MDIRIYNMLAIIVLVFLQYISKLSSFMQMDTYLDTEKRLLHDHVLDFSYISNVRFTDLCTEHFLQCQLTGKFFL